jgi:signal transduction histidine kinase
VLDGEVTPLVRGGENVALLSHRPGLLDDPGLAYEVAAAARLALENERLQAELRAQLEHLRTSRARVVAQGDAERRRLERDLHDGAQQRLVGLSLELGLARSRLGSQPDSALLARIDEAESELETAQIALFERPSAISASTSRSRSVSSASFLAGPARFTRRATIVGSTTHSPSRNCSSARRPSRRMSSTSS